MAKKRQSTREEIEKEATAELNRSIRRSLGPQQSSYASAPRPEAVPSWRQDHDPESPPQGRDQGAGGQADEPAGWMTDHMSASEEEEAVTELAIQQMAERWGGRGTFEDHVMSRVNPTDAEDARDRALRQAMANQARFAKPARRMAVPHAQARGFAGTWTSTSPAVNRPEPMAWESAMPVRDVSSLQADEEAAPARKTPAKRKASATKAAPARKAAAAKKAAPAKKAPGKKAAAVKKAAPAKKAPAKKVAPGKKAPAKKAPAKKAAPSKKAAPAKKVPAKKVAPGKTAPAKKVAPARKAPAAKKAAGRAGARATAPARKRPAR